MRRLIVLLLLSAISISGCGRYTSDVIGFNPEQDKKSISKEEKEENKDTFQVSNEIDLTKVDEEVAHSFLHQVYENPSFYYGAQIKIKGYVEYLYDGAGHTFPAVTIADVSLEFELSDLDSYAIAGALPKEGEVITVTGIFEEYIDYYGETFYHLKNARIVNDII